MRYGVLSDIHGNLPALRATVARLRAAGVDRWLCAGDVIGYGPQPNECVELVADLGAVTVAGNHELMLLGGIPDDRAGKLARDTLRWTRGVLRDDVRAWLAALPRRTAVPGIALAHATLDSAERRIHHDVPAALAELARLGAEQPECRFLIVGHTHLQWACHETLGSVAIAPGTQLSLPAGRYLLNPGSVGQSRQREVVPRARSLVVDVDRSTVTFVAQSYDVGAARRALRRHGLPYDCLHRSPALHARVRRRALRELRKARGRDVYITPSRAP